MAARRPARNLEARVARLKKAPPETWAGLLLAFLVLLRAPVNGFGDGSGARKARRQFNLESSSEVKSALRGSPTFCPTTSPFLNNITVGTPRTPRRYGTALF